MRLVILDILIFQRWSMDSFNYESFCQKYQTIQFSLYYVCNFICIKIYLLLVFILFLYKLCHSLKLISFFNQSFK